MIGALAMVFAMAADDAADCEKMRAHLRRGDRLMDARSSSKADMQGWSTKARGLTSCSDATLSADLLMMRQTVDAEYGRERKSDPTPPSPPPPASPPAARGTAVKVHRPDPVAATMQDWLPGARADCLASDLTKCPPERFRRVITLVLRFLKRAVRPQASDELLDSARDLLRLMGAWPTGSPDEKVDTVAHGMAAAAKLQAIELTEDDISKLSPGLQQLLRKRARSREIITYLQSLAARNDEAAKQDIAKLEALSAAVDARRMLETLAAPGVSLLAEMHPLPLALQPSSCATKDIIRQQATWRMDTLKPLGGTIAPDASKCPGGTPEGCAVVFHFRIADTGSGSYELHLSTVLRGVGERVQAAVPIAGEVCKPAFKDNLAQAIGKGMDEAATHIGYRYRSKTGWVQSAALSARSNLIGNCRAGTIRTHAGTNGLHVMQPAPSDTLGAALRPALIMQLGDMAAFHVLEQAPAKTDMLFRLDWTWSGTLVKFAFRNGGENSAPMLTFDVGATEGKPEHMPGIASEAGWCIARALAPAPALVEAPERVSNWWNLPLAGLAQLRDNEPANDHVGRRFAARDGVATGIVVLSLTGALVTRRLYTEKLIDTLIPTNVLIGTAALSAVASIWWKGSAASQYGDPP